MPDRDRRENARSGNTEYPDSGDAMDVDEPDDSSIGRDAIRDHGVGNPFGREAAGDDDPYFVSEGAASRDRVPSAEARGDATAAARGETAYCPSCDRMTPHEDAEKTVEGEVYRQTVDGLRRVSGETITVSLCTVCGSPSPSSLGEDRDDATSGSGRIRPFAPDQSPREHEAFVRSERERLDDVDASGRAGSSADDSPV